MGRRRGVPVVAMRGLAALPGGAVHFEISRRRSMAAIEYGMLHNMKVLLVAQKDPMEIDPGPDGLHAYGTLCEVRQLARLPMDRGRCMVEGQKRCKVVKVYSGKDMFTAEIVEEERLPVSPKAPVAEAMLQVLHGKVHEYMMLDRRFREQHGQELLTEENVNRLMDRIALAADWNWETMQRFLECGTAEELYELEAGELARMVEVANIRRDFQGKLKESIDKNQRDYVLREQLKLIEQELSGETPGSDAEEYLKKAEELECSEEVREKIKKEVARLRAMPSGSQEYNVIRTYLDTLFELPWDHCSEESTDLSRAEKILDEDHYGLEKVKERVLDYLAVRLLNPENRGAILCLVGPPGTGKTSIAKSVARALNRKYVRISLGGVRDEAEIRGHRKTYVGAMPGRIADALRQAGTANPLLLLDEVDKLSTEYRGATASALLEVLDSEQNIHFRDHYLELPMDLSKVLFIATANDQSTIPGPLIDRMEMIEVTSYTENEKFHIAKDYLVRKQMKLCGIPAGKLEITDEALMRLIRGYTREAGVRQAERKIGELCRKIAREILNGRKRKIIVGEKHLEKYLGKELVKPERRNMTDEVGIVRGLAWTRVGGDTLEIEVNTMAGKGNLTLTGQMGDVMKESAQIALSLVRAEASSWKVPADFFETHDFHLHIPEGAVPKDGPSAGVTMATALLSAASGEKVRSDTAMTGEITLRGRVLPVGGLKEKVLAAKMAELKKVLVPAENRPDIAELSEEITEGLKIVYISSFRDALREAFVK